MVDVVGAAAVAALASAAVWHVLLRPSSASARLGPLRTALTEKSGDLAALRHELQKQRVLLTERTELFSTVGAPQARTPVEENLRTIAGLLKLNGMELTEVAPIGSAQYPGVVELRYRIRGRGSFSNLARMLRQFEACDFWGDITHLGLSGSAGSSALPSNARELDLIVSFYSSTPPPSPSAKAQ